MRNTRLGSGGGGTEPGTNRNVKDELKKHRCPRINIEPRGFEYFTYHVRSHLGLKYTGTDLNPNVHTRQARIQGGHRGHDPQQKNIKIRSVFI
jgi:hypothetical protein